MPANVIAATVSRISRPALKRIWKSLSMDRNGPPGVGAARPCDWLCTFGATSKDIRRPLSAFKKKTFTIIEGCSVEGYAFWKVSVRIGNSLETGTLHILGSPKMGIASALEPRSGIPSFGLSAPSQFSGKLRFWVEQSPQRCVKRSCFYDALQHLRRLARVFSNPSIRE